MNLRVPPMRSRSSWVFHAARAACATACFAVAAGGSLLLAGCGGSGRNTVAATSTPSSTASPAASRFAGVYAGNWTFSAGTTAGAPPTYGGTMTLTIGSSGGVSAVFTDTVGGGQGSFNAVGAVDEDGTITYVPPSPNFVGTRTFSGVAAVNGAGALAASGTLFFDYPGTSSWSASGQPLRSDALQSNDSVTAAKVKNPPMLR